eukprot:scaffold66151_cov63-Phaeocystis_antarctica.AAC.1
MTTATAHTNGDDRHTPPAMHGRPTRLPTCRRLPAEAAARAVAPHTRARSSSTHARWSSRAEGGATFPAQASWRSSCSRASSSAGSAARAAGPPSCRHA